MNLTRQQPRNFAISSPKTLWLAIFALFLLNGCSTIESIDPFSTPPQVVACPEYLILKNAAQISGDNNPDGQPVWQASIERLAGKCVKDGDKISMQLGIKATVTRLDKTTAVPALPYFVAVTDQSQNVVGKQKFSLTPQFDGESLSTTAIDVNDVAFPDSKSLDAFTIYTGLENPPAPRPAATTEPEQK